MHRTARSRDLARIREGHVTINWCGEGHVTVKKRVKESRAIVGRSCRRGGGGAASSRGAASAAPPSPPQGTRTCTCHTRELVVEKRSEGWRAGGSRGGKEGDQEEKVVRKKRRLLERMTARILKTTCAHWTTAH
eukprot:297566-Rhodomonas_salina.2